MSGMDSENNAVWRAIDQPMLALDRKGFAAQMAGSIVKHLPEVDPGLKHIRETGHHMFIHIWPEEKNTSAYSSLAEMAPAGGTAETYIISIMEWTFGIIKTPGTLLVFEYPRQGE